MTWGGGGPSMKCVAPTSRRGPFSVAVRQFPSAEGPFDFGVAVDDGDLGGGARAPATGVFGMRALRD